MGSGFGSCLAIVEAIEKNYVVTEIANFLVFTSDIKSAHLESFPVFDPDPDPGRPV